MKHCPTILRTCVILLLASYPLCGSEVLVDLDLRASEVGRPLPFSSEQSVPLSMPVTIQCEPPNILEIRPEFRAGELLLPMTGDRILLMEKVRGAEPLEVRFEWPEQAAQDANAVEVRLGLLLAKEAQSGNLMLHVRTSRAGPVIARLQIGATGLISVSEQNAEGTVHRFESLPMDVEIQNFVIRLDRSSGELTLSIDGRPIGYPVALGSEWPPGHLAIFIPADTASRRVGFSAITVTAGE